MPVAIGDRLGPYEIVDTLGAGGMGEVYRATDSRLRRDVAIKIATAQFSDRSALEARVVAALNHSNICHIYDVGPNYLVMELIEGPTLADRLNKGPLPVDEALTIASQIAQALEAAHEKGIVHRDLKPGNIKIRPDGTVKVLDFGLATIVEATSPAESSATLTLENATRAGAVVGTAAYMAPEQARGKPVDKRADIWAFGVVLYEMLCGHRPFPGETVSDTLAAVLTREPDWDCVPAKAQRLVKRCLEKDLQQRLRDIGDARFLLGEPEPAAAAQTSSALPWKIAAATLAIVLAGGAIWALRFMRQNTNSAVMRLNVDFGSDAALTARRASPIALSPDGTRIVFPVGEQFVNTRLAIRRLDQPNSILLPGTEGAEAPFFSPDGKFVGFFADGKLKKTDVEGGAPVMLCDAPRPRGGSWGDDGNIVFAPTNQGGLSRVPSTGGVPQPVTQLDKTRGDDSQRYPQVLPGAEAVLFTAGLDFTGEGSIDVQSFKTGKRKTLVESGAYGRYLPSGHLVYMHRNVLFAAPMDPARLELTGPSAPVLEDVSYRSGTGTAALTFSQTGIFVYAARNSEDRLREIRVIDDRGHSDILPVPKGSYSNPRVSPDGTRFAVMMQEGQATSIWIYEWANRRFMRLAFSNGNAEFPVWTADSKHVLFSSDEQSPGPGVYCESADGAGAPGRVIDGPGLIAWSVSAQPSRLAFQKTKGPNSGIWLAALDARDSACPTVRQSEFLMNEDEAAFSPDGRWLAYGSGQSGLPEVLVRPIPGPGGPWQVSSGGGWPVWSRNGSELFYRGMATTGFPIMSVGYSTSGNSFSAAKPRVWSDSHVDSFDVMPDGKHVVAVPAGEIRQSTHAVFLLNFMDELRRRLPSKR